MSSCPWAAWHPSSSANGSIILLVEDGAFQSVCGLWYMKCGVSSIESMAGVACRGLRCVEMTIHKCIVVFLHC